MWRKTIHVVIFGHQSFIFPTSQHTCSGISHGVPWDFPNPGGRQRSPVLDAAPGPRLWQYRQVEIADVRRYFLGLTNTWQSQGTNSRLYGWSEKRSQPSSMAAIVPTVPWSHLLDTHHICSTPGYSLSANALSVSRFVLTKSNNIAQLFPCPPLVQ